MVRQQHRSRTPSANIVDFAERDWVVRREPWQQRERRLCCRGHIGVGAQRLKHGAVLGRAQLACKILLLLLGSQRRSSPQRGEELRCHPSHDDIGA